MQVRGPIAVWWSGFLDRLSVARPRGWPPLLRWRAACTGTDRLPMTGGFDWSLRIRPAYAALMRFATSRRFGAPPAGISSVRLGIMLTEPWERELLTSFVRAAVASSMRSRRACGRRTADRAPRAGASGMP